MASLQSRISTLASTIAAEMSKKVASTSVDTFVVSTAAAYAALGSKDSRTIYWIVG